MRIGPKLWSVNVSLISEAERLIDDGIFAYVELTIVPGSDITPFTDAGLPMVVHAPTDRHGVDLGDSNRRDVNHAAIEFCIHAADRLNARFIILHPGAGDIREVSVFLSTLDDKRVLIENMPKTGIHDETMVGSTASELETLMDGRFGLCLDLNHAVKAACGYSLPFRRYVETLLELQPDLFHISDGHGQNCKDEHLALGGGDYDLQYMAECVQTSAHPAVTLETPRLDMATLDEDRLNAARLRSYL
jgi:deoxyribonuclease-4